LIISEFVAKKGINRGATNGVPSYGKFKADKFSYLNITSIGGDLVERNSICAFACLETPPCFSFNLAAFPDINGKLLCELLPSDKYNNSDKLVPSNVFHHYSIASPCNSLPCKNNGKCVSLYEEDSYVCFCTVGFTGKNCETVSSIASTIIANNVVYQSHLNQFLAPAVGNDSKWLLCYRASSDGWDVSNFHTKCDGKPHTVTIIKVGDHVFGGYTDIPWESSASYGFTSKAFIFSLHNNEGLGPFKSMVIWPFRAIYRNAGLGPTFGGVTDILIANNANSNQYSRTNFGRSYSVPNGVQNRGTLLAGSYNFSPDDWEVFYLA